MIPNRDKNTDISTEVAQGKNFRRRLMTCAEEAGKRFMEGGRLSDIIADIAKRESFNRMQIQRLVEEANTVAFNKRYDQLRGVNDRRVSFELASLADVVEVMGSDAPPEMINPNLVTGKAGEGSIEKEASDKTQTTSRFDGWREMNANKRAQERAEAIYKEAKMQSKELESNIVKVASCLLQNELRFKNGNQLFNTMLDKVAFDDSIVDGIVKTASLISDKMKESHRLRKDFVLSLSVEPQEKIASTLFGKHSLIKQADEFVEKPKFHPVNGVQDIQQLFDIAKKIQKSQNQVVELDKSLHGGTKQ